MAQIELHLIGRPRLVLEGKEAEVRPPMVFQLLAVILTSGAEGITRPEAASRLWGHLEPSDARASLRLAIHKLREELRRLQIDDAFDLGNGHLRTTGHATIDLDAVAAEPPRDLDAIERLLLPVAEGWDPEHWLAQRDAFGEVIAGAFEALPNGTDEKRLVKLLTKATSIYPTTTRLVIILAAHLQSQGRDAELNELLIAFEDRWVDRFGTGDIPDVKRLLIERASPPDATSSRKVRTWQVTLAAAVLLCAYLLVIAGFGSKDQEPPKLSIVKSWQTEFRGQTFRVDQLHLHDDSNGRVDLKSRLRSGEFALVLQNRSDSWDVILDPKRATVGEADDKFMVDRDGAFTARYTGTGESASLVGPGGELILRGTPTTPKVWPTKFLADGSLLFARKGEDPAGHPLKFFLLRDGRETEVALPGVNAKTLAITFMSDRHLYAKYSLGSSDGWRYHSFVYDLISGTSKPLACGPVVAMFSNGDLITRPLETTVTRTKDGIDHDTHDDGTVVVEDAHGRAHTIKLEDEAKFPWVFTLGDLLILERAHTSAFDDLWFLDSNLEPCDPFPFLKQRVASIGGSDGKSVLIRAFNPKEESMDYFLISLVQP